MNTATATSVRMPSPVFRRVVVNVPADEMKRFRTIVRTLGVEFEKPSATYETWEAVPVALRKQIEEARAEYERGETKTFRTPEEMQQYFDRI